MLEEARRPVYELEKLALGNHKKSISKKKRKSKFDFIVEIKNL